MEAPPRVKIVRHVGGLHLANGRRDHDTSYCVSRARAARRMVGLIARSSARSQDRRGLPLRLRPTQATSILFVCFSSL